MDKVIPNGTEVLIFNYIPNWGPKQDEERFIRGVIKDSEIIDEPDLHGSSWNVRFYCVLGEDGDTYHGTYDQGMIGSHYFRTIEDHIDHIKRKIKDNYNKINELNDQNFELFELISSLRENQNTPDLTDNEKNNTTYPVYKKIK